MIAGKPNSGEGAERMRRPELGRGASILTAGAVTMLLLASGPRSSLNVFDDPARRVANPPAPTGGVEARRV